MDSFKETAAFKAKAILNREPYRYSSQMRDYLNLIFYKVIFSLRAEARQSYLNYFWWILEPILHMGVFYIVFDVFMQSGVKNYVAYLLTGLVPWVWFSRSVSNSSTSILHGVNLMLQIDISKTFFPTVVVGQDFFKECVVLVLLLCFLFFYGIQSSLNWLWLLPTIFLHFLLVYACALMAALIVPFIPDLRFVIITILQLLMFASGLFYSYDIISENHRFLFFLNPVAASIKNFRNVLLYSSPPDFRLSLYVFSFSVILLALGFFLARLFHYAYPRIASR
jgi:lipopolysaccharide transport system permease protein